MADASKQEPVGDCVWSRTSCWSTGRRQPAAYALPATAAAGRVQSQPRPAVHLLPTISVVACRVQSPRRSRPCVISLRPRLVAYNPSHGVQSPQRPAVLVPCQPTCHALDPGPITNSLPYYLFSATLWNCDVSTYTKQI